MNKKVMQYSKNLQEEIIEMGQMAKNASRQIAIASSAIKNNVLITLAQLLEKNIAKILTQNAKDIKNAEKNNMDAPRIDRLRLTEKSIKDIAQACLFVANLPDPVGAMKEQKKQNNGLLVGRMHIPLGVIAMVYESRPNVTIDAAILCLKAGNAVILRGGSEAFYSNMIFASLLEKALEQHSLPKEIVQIIKNTDRQSIDYLCQLDEYIDVIIPRGGEQMVRTIASKARMPVLKHDKGVPHVFVDESANFDDTINIIYNAKVQRPGVCNALEGVLIHEKIAQEFLPKLVESLAKASVLLHVCPRAFEILEGSQKINQTRLENNPEQACSINNLKVLQKEKNKKAKTKKDKKTEITLSSPMFFPLDDSLKGHEFAALEMLVMIVNSLDEALDYIHAYGSHHTEVICTNNYENAQRFLREADASMVAVNASTRFNDGGQLGLGAEIGICTSKLHAYGPMGINELTTTKFVVFGSGQVRT